MTAMERGWWIVIALNALVVPVYVARGDLAGAVSAIAIGVLAFAIILKDRDLRRLREDRCHPYGASR